MAAVACGVGVAPVGVVVVVIRAETVGVWAAMVGVEVTERVPVVALTVFAAAWVGALMLGVPFSGTVGVPPGVALVGGVPFGVAVIALPAVVPVGIVGIAIGADPGALWISAPTVVPPCSDAA